MPQSGRTKRRIIAMLSKRIGEARLDQVADPRDPRGRRWALDTLLGGALLGLMAGDEQRTRAWRAVMREFLLASLTATAEQLGRLRRHRLGQLPS